ncbi:MAG: hypothetical protein K9N47_15160 [Prosthecobacter sp.]|uniref:hypothetical protein n=1 Tax=Prosthecobacter sp. TaxID=1965333 RepID=UPI0025FC5851|nr:hypothetical protein [Prosthecobacter sp.]MCF7787467.1 hypothetical protein [Prosthecobacter sp.]
MSRSSMYQSLERNLLRVLRGLLYLTVFGSVGADAEEASPVFIAPEAYSLGRYEAGWNKNPFTLKTLPVVAAQDSFAKDLAIAAYYGDSEDPTVVVVNTKTGERTKLKKTQASASGMQLKSVTLGSGRKDIAAEVTLGTETSELRFNVEYTKQVAAAETTQTPAGQPPSARQSGAPVQVKPPALPRLPFQASKAGGPSALPQPRIPVSFPSSPQGKPVAAVAGRPMMPATGATAVGSNPGSSNPRMPPTNAGQPVSSTPVVVTGTPARPSRRRLVVPPTSLPSAP